MFYGFAGLAVRLVLRIFARCRVDGLENVPLTEPFMLVSNHIGLVDPPVLGALIPRRIAFMAKEEAFRVPVTGWMVRWYGAFPVRRGQADRQALRSATAVLERGGVVGMFPEGTRSKTGQMIRAYSGAALVVLSSGAKVLPVAITGTDQVRSVFSLIRRPTITVRVGKPLILDRKRAGRDGLEAATRTMMARVAALLPEERRGFYRDTVEEHLISGVSKERTPE